MVTAKAAVKTTTAADPGPVQLRDVERDRVSWWESRVGLEGNCIATRNISGKPDGFCQKDIPSVTSA
ncbi:hypothetical protein E2562_032295 [Oryza meyeriana var. granulata]|uniref:Uncharacterized protein n=1 Tax=Oryza meyeriana var. granulata TaxID=110450 RepID=A0A6G1F0K2_9ORYZ|nr:hypothetical protein E2562_032295 [Oryza meyeriana var. granulata]